MIDVHQFMTAVRCAWCGCFILEEESHEVAVLDEETGEPAGYEIVGDCCYDFWHI